MTTRIASTHLLGSTLRESSPTVSHSAAASAADRRDRNSLEAAYCGGLSGHCAGVHEDERQALARELLGLQH
jgi:hypothetical protein